MSSPVGTEVARIDSDASGAVLRRARAPPRSAPSFAALTEHLLGAALDPAALAAWLHGATPRAARQRTGAVTIDETQRAGAVDLAGASPPRAATRS